jgi:LL-diaminopimelate aminotransferase
MHTQTPQASLYVWAHIPARFTTSREFVSWLFDETGVLLTPGTNFGPSGEGYVRISIAAPEERIATALQRMQNAL